MLSMFVLLTGINVCLAQIGGEGPVDCAFSVWSEWYPHSSGQFEVRTRTIWRQAKEGGKPCSGKDKNYRNYNNQPDGVPVEIKFLSRFLPGNSPTYSLGRGNSNTHYTLSRDILVMLDTTVVASHFPHCKILAAIMLGKICDAKGPKEDRVAMVTFDSIQSSIIHNFRQGQDRAELQDEILAIPASNNKTQLSNLSSALSFAKTTIENEASRGYNRATKEVLMFTSYRGNCNNNKALLRAARRLGAAAVVYVIVIGEGVTISRPKNWCLEDDVASDPPAFHFLQLQNVERISQLSRILLNLSPDSNVFCQTKSE